MEEIELKISDQDFEDLVHALILAMKTLDNFKNGKGSDKKLADRLEILLKKIEDQNN